MPVLLITAEEMFQAKHEEALKLALEITALADVAQRPLQPGESPSDRYHKVAKLGKQLAEAFIALDKFVSRTAEALGVKQPETDPDVEPADKPGAN